MASTLHCGNEPDAVFDEISTARRIGPEFVRIEGRVFRDGRSTDGMLGYGDPGRKYSRCHACKLYRLTPLHEPQCKLYAINHR